MPTFTLKELVLDQINHRETDPIPYTLGMEENVAERLDDYYGDPSWRELLTNAIVRWSPSGMVVDQTSADFTMDHYGSRWQVNRRPFHLVEPALDAPSLKGYTFPDLDTLFGPEWKEEANAVIAEHRARGRFIAVGLGFGLFERTWTLRGFNEVMMDAAIHPDFYHALVEAVAEHQMAIVARLLTLPVDGVMFSDDWGYQRGVLLGPDRWRQFIKPRLARLYAQVHDAGKRVLTHCCGSVADIMPDIIEVGLDVLESVQPEARGMDPYALKRQYGDQITFWGGLGSQSTIPFGTPDEIRTEVARLCQEMGRGGGYILTPAKALQPETPTENAAAVVESFLAQFGITLPCP
jgi:uroporphyrinogen decarboxylase